MRYIKKIKYNSPVILTFTFICLLALFLGYLTNGYTTEKIFSVYRASLKDPLSYIRVFAYIFGHADFEHFFSNFLIILIIGPMLEEKYGSKNLIILIFITAIISGIFQVITSESGLLGASGIAFMLITLTSFVNIEGGRIPLTTIIVVFMYLGKEIYYGMTIDDNISRFTHILGGICGIMLGIILNVEDIINVESKKNTKKRTNIKKRKNIKMKKGIEKENIEIEEIKKDIENKKGGF